MDAFIAVDADLRPVRLTPVSASEGRALISDGEAHSLMPRSRYRLVWATRHGETRWFVFPK